MGWCPFLHERHRGEELQSAMNLVEDDKAAKTFEHEILNAPVGAYGTSMTVICVQRIEE
jgi:hypothetical protein